MKLIVQIPCFNEEQTIAQTIRDIPRNIEGVERVEVLVIDDGSSDKTVEMAQKAGADHIVCHPSNRGLAESFRTGIDTCLRLHADIIVNTDADNQYCGADIVKLVDPILKRKADFVLGDRNPGNNRHFSFQKKCLQILGSFAVRTLSGLRIHDAVSGFRAYSREVAVELIVLSDFSYTIETLLQLGKSRFVVTSVPIRTNPKARESRLFRSIPEFLYRSGKILIRAHLTYSPLPILLTLCGIFGLIGIVPLMRFLCLFLIGQGQGHIQSVVLGSVSLVIALLFLVMGILAELISWNRKLLEKNLIAMKKIELKLHTFKHCHHFVQSERDLS